MKKKVNTSGGWSERKLRKNLYKMKETVKEAKFLDKRKMERRRENLKENLKGLIHENLGGF